MLLYHHEMRDSFTLSHQTQVNRESLSAQTKLDTTMCPEGEARNRQNCGTTGQRGMVLVRVIREHPSDPADLAAGDQETSHTTP